MIPKILNDPDHATNLFMSNICINKAAVVIDKDAVATIIFKYIENKEYLYNGC